MRVVSYVYDSTRAGPTVAATLDAIASREEAVDLIDVGTGGDREDVRREALLTVKSAVRVGSLPDALFDGDGRFDVSAGVLITEAPTGRRSLHVGREALKALGAEE